VSKIDEYKSLGDALGMPSEADREFLRHLILKFEREHPGEIKAMRDGGRELLKINGAFNGRQKFGVTGKQANMRMMFNLPPILFGQIERYFPTMFREKKHFHWFCKHFKEMALPEKF
jgi:hypothetical protein